MPNIHWPDKNIRRIASIGECMIEISDAENLQQRFAGDSLNVAVHLVRELAGTPIKIDYVTAVGEDPFSIEMVKFCKKEGIGVDLIATVKDKLPGLYWIKTDVFGERTFHYWRANSAARDLLKVVPEKILAKQLVDHDLVYLSGISVAILPDSDKQQLLNSLQALRAQGAIIAFDSNYRPILWQDSESAKYWTARFYEAVDLALVSFLDEQKIFSDANQKATLARIHAYGVSEIVVKNGAAACQILCDKMLETVESVEGISQVDSTGAGDSFNAAYMAARIIGDSPSDAARKGHLLASQVVQYSGAIGM